MNNAGTLLCASSHSHNGDRGQVRVFELSGSTWSQVAEFEGSDSDDLLGFNTMGVDMTNDGSRIAMAASNAPTNGIVQVFDDEVVVGENGMEIDTFDWDLDFLLNETEIAFSEDADTSEVVLHYNISIRDTLIRAFEADCVTPIPSNVTTLTSQSVQTSPTHANFTVFVDLKQDTIKGSGVWTDVVSFLAGG